MSLGSSMCNIHTKCLHQISFKFVCKVMNNPQRNYLFGSITDNLCVLFCTLNTVSYD